MRQHKNYVLSSWAQYQGAEEKVFFKELMHFLYIFIIPPLEHQKP